MRQSIKTTFLLLLAGWTPLSLANDCTTKPIRLVERNVTVANGKAISRGIPIRFGVDPETSGGGHIATLRPSSYQNFTHIRNTADCKPDDRLCLGEIGGGFDLLGSKIFESGTTAAGTPSYDGRAREIRQLEGLDTIGFDDKNIPPLENFPIEIWTSDQNSSSLEFSALPFGLNSSLINALYDNGIVPSKTWSYYAGKRYQSTGYTDGELVIGGYRPGIIDGEWTEFDISKPYRSGDRVADCILEVKVKSMQLLNLEGRTSEIISHTDRSTLGQDGVPFCLDMHVYNIKMVTQLYTNWARETEHLGKENRKVLGEENMSDQLDDTLYPNDKHSKLGSLTIELNNGYRTTIPESILISRQTGVSPETGAYEILNNTRWEAAVDNVSGWSELGRVYLSQNYLIVDYEKGKFWLAPLVADELIKLTSDPDDLEAICSESAKSGANGSGDKGAGSLVGADPEDESKGKKGLGAGAIAGIAVGAVLFIICVVLFVLYRKGLLFVGKKPAEPVEFTGKPELDADGTATERYVNPGMELEGAATVELAANKAVPIEIGGRELQR